MKKEYQINTKYLNKRLEHHSSSCTVHIYSADQRVCSCGRDEAINEKEILEEAAKLLINIKRWLDVYEELHPNSAAHMKADEIVEKLERMK